MKKKNSPKSLFWSKLFSFLIDATVVYCITFLIEGLISNFYKVNTFYLYSIIWFAYYACCYHFLRGQSLAKLLLDLQIVTSNENQINFRTVLLRETSKIFLLLVVLAEVFNCTSGKAFYAMLIIYIVMILLTFVLTFTVRKTLWDIVAKTNVVKLKVRNKKARVISLIALVSIFVVTVGVKISPVVSNPSQFKTSFYNYNNAETKEYTEFIKTHKQDPVDYVFELFKKYDLVVLSERLHPEYTQYELITKIIYDKRFQNIGNIYTECGSRSFQSSLNSYLKTDYNNKDSLDMATAILQRNSNAIWPLWSNTNLFDLLENVNKLNRNFPDSLKVNWYFTDVPVDWETMTSEKYKVQLNDRRDELMANQIIDIYKDKTQNKERRKKGLIIMNTRHGYGLVKNSNAKKLTNTTAFLMKEYPNKVCNVMINTVSQMYVFMFTPIQNGNWDKAFLMAGNPNIGFNFKGSPFGSDRFDAFLSGVLNIKYEDIFTGFIFYEPLEKHFKKEGFPFMFYKFKETLLKRANCVSSSNAEMWKIRIENNKDGDVNTGNFPYGLIYNGVSIIGFGLFVFLVIIVSLIAYFRNGNKSTNRTPTA